MKVWDSLLELPTSLIPSLDAKTATLEVGWGWARVSGHNIGALRVL